MGLKYNEKKELGIELFLCLYQLGQSSVPINVRPTGDRFSWSEEDVANQWGRGMAYF